MRPEDEDAGRWRGGKSGRVGAEEQGGGRRGGSGEDRIQDGPL